MVKLLTLAFVGILVASLEWAFEESSEEGNWWSFAFFVVLLVPCIALLLWIGLVLYTRPIITRLRYARAFRRVRGAGRIRRASQESRPGLRAEADAGLPDSAVPQLRVTPRGQAPLFQRAGLLLLFGLPGAFFIGYCLLAYLDELLSLLFDPMSGSWDWDAPQEFTDFGGLVYTEENLGILFVAGTLSLLSLVGGISLMLLSVPVLTRHGADAIDLAVTDSGIVTRGGLTIAWDEMSEILVVRDTRLTKLHGRRNNRTPLEPRISVNPTFISGHSRTRIAIVPVDLPDIAARSSRSQSRSMRMHRSGTFGYVLCDLWVHSQSEVAEIRAVLSDAAREQGVPVAEIERGYGDDMWAAAPAALRP